MDETLLEGECPYCKSNNLKATFVKRKGEVLAYCKDCKKTHKRKLTISREALDDDMYKDGAW